MKDIEHIDIDQLTFLESNPRTISKDAMQKLCESVKKDPGFLTCRPILVNKNNDQMQIYAGSQRVRAAKQLGWKKVPCIVEELDEEEMKRRMLIDNQHSGDWDYDILADQFEIDMLIEVGFDEKDLEIDIDDEKQTKQNSKEEKKCPNCGYEL